jgi:alanine racemase
MGDLRDKFPEVCRAEINLSQLKRNMEFIRSTLKHGVRFMAVVKGDAYGHGLVPISKALAQWGSDFLGVVRLTEAENLRIAGINLPIVMLAPLLPSQIEAAVDLDISPMLDSCAMAEKINNYAGKKGKTVNIHVKINTGLNRYGVLPEKALDFILTIREKYKNLNIEGIYTHFRDPELNLHFTEQQLKRFREVLSQLEKEGARPSIAHSSASGGILMYPEAQFDMVRVGILLYGVEYMTGKKILPGALKPVLSIKSNIIKLIDVKDGENGGYGDRFIAHRDSKLAVIAAGYGDGVSRGWKEALVRGHRVPIVNYSMDGIVADITEIQQEIEEFDEAVLVGKQGNEYISWDEACRGLDSEVDEQLQRITERVVKNYFYEF